MVEISLSGSGEEPWNATTGAYSTMRNVPVHSASFRIPIRVLGMAPGGK
jgi:hypothetical protein